MPEASSKKFVRRAFVKTALRRIIALTAIAGLIYGLAAMVYATKTIFKVKKNYAVVLEKFGGQREAVTRVGWHVRLPFFTSIEQEVGVLTYRIRDLSRWAIENLNPQLLLQGDYDGIVKDILQAQEVNALVSAREMIKEDIFQALKSRPINEGGPTLEEKYGIEIVSFVLKETRFGDKLIEATEEKKRRQLIAEAENDAADQEASRIRKLYAAYLDGIQSLQEAVGRKDGSTDTALLEFLTQQKWATAYEKNQAGQRTVVIQNTQTSPALTLPAPEPSPSDGGKKAKKQSTE